MFYYAAMEVKVVLCLYDVLTMKLNVQTLSLCLTEVDVVIMHLYDVLVMEMKLELGHLLSALLNRSIQSNRYLVEQ